MLDTICHRASIQCRVQHVLCALCVDYKLTCREMLGPSFAAFERVWRVFRTAVGNDISTTEAALVH